MIGETNEKQGSVDLEKDENMNETYFKEGTYTMVIYWRGFAQHKVIKIKKKENQKVDLKLAKILGCGLNSEVLF